MKNISPSKSLPAEALKIIKKLRQHGFKSYLVGGCVRDQLLDIKPHEYDIVTDAKPDQIKKIFRRNIKVGAHFGVIKVLTGKNSFEVATFREDGNYLDGRHPEEVFFSDEKTDTLRRDFTINGILYDPIVRQYIDYIGGEQDLKNRIVRAIGDPSARFSEDGLRILRAIRFACRFDFSIHPDTWQAMKECSLMIKQISSERIREELMAILTSGKPQRGLTLLNDCGVLSLILPELTNNLAASSKLLENCANLASGQAETAFAAILYNIEISKVFEILKQLRFSNQELKQITSILKMQHELMQASSLKKYQLRKLMLEDFFSEALKFNQIVTLALNKDPQEWIFCKAAWQEFKAEFPEFHPLLNGEDLKLLGYKPGPIFSKILEAVKEVQLEGQLKNKAQALVWVKENFRLN